MLGWSPLPAPACLCIEPQLQHPRQELGTVEDTGDLPGYPMCPMGRLQQEMGGVPAQLVHHLW